MNEVRKGRERKQCNKPPPVSSVAVLALLFGALPLFQMGDSFNCNREVFFGVSRFLDLLFGIEIDFLPPMCRAMFEAQKRHARVDPRKKMI